MTPDDEQPGETRKPRFGAADIGFFAAAFALLAYFGANALLGESGLLGRIALEGRIAELREERAALAAKRGALENEAQRLSDSYLDLDLVGEKARAQLSLAHDRDLVAR